MCMETSERGELSGSHVWQDFAGGCQKEEHTDDTKTNKKRTRGSMCAVCDQKHIRYERRPSKHMHIIDKADDTWP